MLRRTFKCILDRRALRILRRLDPHLPHRGVLIDIGSGTGHNARAIRVSRPALAILELDVVPMTPPDSPPPLIIIDGTLPLADASADVGVMLYVLHYVDDPRATFVEAARVIRGRLILLQTTADGWIARAWWKLRDAFLGRLPFHLCRALGLIKGGECPMQPRHFFTRAALLDAAATAGWRCVHISREAGIVATLSRDLIVLEKTTSPAGAANAEALDASFHYHSCAQ